MTLTSIMLAGNHLEGQTSDLLPESSVQDQAVAEKEKQVLQLFHHSN